MPLDNNEKLAIRESVLRRFWPRDFRQVDKTENLPRTPLALAEWLKENIGTLLGGTPPERAACAMAVFFGPRTGQAPPDDVIQSIIAVFGNPSVVEPTCELACQRALVWGYCHTFQLSPRGRSDGIVQKYRCPTWSPN